MTAPLYVELRELHPELRFSMDPDTGMIEFRVPGGERTDDAFQCPIGARLKVRLWCHNEGVIALMGGQECASR